MAQVLPGLGELLGPGIQDFAKGLESYLKPNLEFQKGMQKLIGANPQLAQQFADLEANAPGTLNRLGFGELGKIISQIPESEQSQFQRQNREKILGVQEQKLNLEGAQTGFDFERLNDTINYLKDPNNKEIKADIVLKKLTGETSAQRRRTEAQATTEEAQATTAPQYFQEKLKQEQAASQKAQIGQKLQLLAPDMAHYDFARAAERFFNHGMSGEESASLLATPGVSDAFRLAISDYERRKSEGFQAWLRAQKEDLGEDKVIATDAFRMYRDSGYTGSWEAWKTILTDPTAAEKAKAKPVTEQSDEDKALIRADEANQRSIRSKVFKETTAIDAGIRRAMIDARVAWQKDDAEGQQVALSNLQNALDQRTEITGVRYIPKMGKRPEVGNKEYTFFGGVGEGSGLYFVDEQGRRIKDDEIFTTPKPTVSGEALDFYQTYIDPKNAGIRDAALENIRKNRPDFYKIVKQMIDTTSTKSKK